MNTCKWMDTVFPDALTPIVYNSKTHINLPDEDDVHVAETAIISGANYIITFNLKDFPKEELGKHGIEAIHPDDFVCQLLKDEPDVVLRAFNNQVSMLKKPAKTSDDVLVALKKCGLTKTAKQLRRILRTSSDT